MMRRRISSDPSLRGRLPWHQGVRVPIYALRALPLMMIVFGPDANSNPKLALAISTAKKAGFPKASIEAAISRGQGTSATGAALESLIIEAMLPTSVAAIIDCKTDNKPRTLQEVRHLVKTHEGIMTPTSHLFEKIGRIIIRGRDGLTLDEVLEAALEAGALDVNEGADGKFVVKSEPNGTREVCTHISKALQVQVESADVVWDPKKETSVELNDTQIARRLGEMFDGLQPEWGVQAVYLNASPGALNEDAWKDLQAKIAF
jgi:transcriptional/translational regulatory protein YebC/TACO1